MRPATSIPWALLALTLFGCAGAPVKLEDIPSLTDSDLIRETAWARSMERGYLGWRGRSKDKHIAALLDEAFQRRPQWDEDVREAIVNEQIQLGMTASQVRLSWGNPSDVNRTVSAHGTHEQWVYGRFTTYSTPHHYLYFDDGVLTSWQN